MSVKSNPAPKANMPRRNSGSVANTTSQMSDGSSYLKDELLSIPEEEGDENPDDFNEFEQSKLPPKTGEYYYQDFNYVKPTQAAFDRKQVHEATLFDHAIKLERADEEFENQLPIRDESILVTGFGMRNVDSFQNVLRMSHEERIKKELRKLWRDKQEQEMLEQEKIKREEVLSTARSDTTVTSTSTRGTRRSSSDSLIQTDSTRKDADLYDTQRPLDYLLGLETEVEEGQDDEAEEEEAEIGDAFKYSSSKSIRDAQRYLRAHHVFECFQFIVAHLLSANPENPIEFILNLLNKCLLYRSGLGDAPLLYEKRHIGQLFNLMDRLQVGFIDFAQYKSGMKTLAICTFNESPDINVDDLISKETFIEEAYEAELAIFNELLRKRPEKNKKKVKAVPSYFQSVSVASINPPYFIPSALLGFHRKEPIDNIQDFCEG